MKFSSQLSVSITPESLYEFARQRIIDLGYATAEQMVKSPGKGWSRYIQRLIEHDRQLDLMQSRGVVNGAVKQPARPRKKSPARN